MRPTSLRFLRPSPTRAGRLRALVALLWTVAGWTVAVAEPRRTTLLIYTAIEADQQVAFKAAIEAALPEVGVEWVYGHTGEITAQLIAEKEHPRADLILGLAATSLISLEGAGLLLPYRPPGADALRSEFIDRVPPYSWTGMDAYTGAACVSTRPAAGARTPRLVRWLDLLDLDLKNSIVMPDPTSTGTGYLLVAGWIQSMGEAAAWRFMDALDRNISAYVPSGAAPCTEVAAGHAAIGLTYDVQAARLKAQGAPLDVAVPIDGVGWDLEAAAIVRSSPHIDLDMKVIDWAAGLDANRLYAQTYAIVAHPDVIAAPAAYPSVAEARMVRNDLAWMADNRARILADWKRRYGSKVRTTRP